MHGSGGDALLPSSFVVRTVTVAPGGQRAFVDAEWRDAIVVVSRGEMELEALAGTRWRFARGDVMWLSGLPLRALHNRADEPAILVAVARRIGDATW